MSQNEILILPYPWNEPGSTPFFSSDQKMISQIFFFTSYFERNYYIICFFQCQVNYSPLMLPTPFLPLRFYRTPYTVTQNSSYSAVFYSYFVSLAKGTSRTIFFLPFEMSDCQRMAFLLVSLTETEFANLFYLLSADLRSLNKGRVLFFAEFILGSCWLGLGVYWLMI